MRFIYKRLLTFLSVINFSIAGVWAETTITYSSNYGLENILFFSFIVFHLLFWIWILAKTKPIKIDNDRLLSSLINSVTRVLSYVWLFVLMYMSRGVLFISSNPEFLDDKLFLINMMYYLTFFFLGLFILLIFIKHSSKITGLTDFIENVMYEVKNG